MANTGDLNSILQVARPLMRELSEKIGETVVLHRIDGDQAVVVEQVISEAEVVRVQHREGSRHPLFLCASGRALLAWQPDRLVKRVLEQSGRANEVRLMLEQTRVSGYATSQNELQLGVVGAAVPLIETEGVVRYSLTVLVPSQRADKLDDALKALLESRCRMGTHNEAETDRKILSPDT